MNTIFAYRLKAARIQKGISQEILATALNISKQAVSQFEKGKKNPSSTTLISVAKYFQKPIDYFLRPLITPLDKVEFRKRASLKGRKLEAVKVSIQDHLEPYLELENIVGVNVAFDNPFEGKAIRTEAEAEAAAAELLHVWNLGLNPIPNILEMLEDKSIKIIEVQLDAKFDGLSTWVNDTIPIIVLNQNIDNLRKRFTALHELGHLLLTIPDGVEHKIKEKICNRFAGAMLLPETVIKDEIGIKRSRISISELIPIKEYYGISLAAMVYRCGELGFFPQALTKRFWQARNTNPKLKTEEGFGHYQGEERAYRFMQLLSKALAEELISFSKAKELAGKQLDDLTQNYQLI